MKPQNIGIDISGLSRSFGETKALDGLTLKLEPGRFTVLRGPDGAGKTTLMRILAGLLHADTGSIKYTSDGAEIAFRKRPSVLASMPSQQSLYPDLSIDEHLIFFKDLYSLTESDFRQRSAELLGDHAALKSSGRERSASFRRPCTKSSRLMCRDAAVAVVDACSTTTNGRGPISRRKAGRPFSP